MDKELAQLEKQEFEAAAEEVQKNGSKSKVYIFVALLVSILLIIILGIVVGTVNNEENVNVETPTQSPILRPTLSPSFNPTISPSISPTENPSLNPTRNPTGRPSLPSTSPTRSPIALDFKATEFFAACLVLEISAIENSNYYNGIDSGFSTSIDVLTGLFTCVDQTILACDIDQELVLFEGHFCEVVDPSFQCQCGQGVLNIITDGAFGARNELACAASVEDAGCNAAGEELETELLDSILAQYFYYYVNDVVGDEVNSSSYYYDYLNSDDFGELQDFGYFFEESEDFLFDLIFDCEAGLEFSSCLDRNLLFICVNQTFVVEACGFLSEELCSSPPREVVPLEEGAIACDLNPYDYYNVDFPTVNPTTNPTAFPTTANPGAFPTFSPSSKPTEFQTFSPSRSPIALDFRATDFFNACFFLEFSALADSFDNNINNGLNTSFGLVFGLFTCIDQSLVSCDIDQEQFLLEGTLCGVVDPSFECQCGQGVINVLFDGPFDGRNQLACASSVENAECNVAGDELEAEFLNILHTQFFYYYVNDIEGDEFSSSYSQYTDFTFYQFQELEDFGIYFEGTEDLLFDLIFDCEGGFDFSTCIDQNLLFVCSSQSFTVEICGFGLSGECTNPVGDVIPLEEGVISCDSDPFYYYNPNFPTVNPTANPNIFETFSPTVSPTKFPITSNPAAFPTFNPSSKPTQFQSLSPTRSPIALDFRATEFFTACLVLEISAFGNSNYYNGVDSGFNTSIGVLTGLFTCVDQTILACDIDQELVLFEGHFCEVVDPSFQCQCGQGVLNIITDGAFGARNELACAASVEDAGCNAAGEELETELLDTILAQFFYYYVNDVVGDEFNSSSYYSDYLNFDDFGELQDFGYLFEENEDFLFDLIFDCEAGLEFSSCLDRNLLFICVNQTFVVEACGFLSEELCSSPPREIVSLEEGAIACDLNPYDYYNVDFPTVNPTTNPTAFPTTANPGALPTFSPSSNPTQFQSLSPTRSPIALDFRAVLPKKVVVENKDEYAVGEVGYVKENQKT